MLSGAGAGAARHGAGDLAADLIDELESAIRRVELSRQFLNDAVEACLRIRDNKLVNWFKLAGHTPLPQAWVMVDRMPEGLMYLGA